MSNKDQHQTLAIPIHVATSEILLGMKKTGFGAGNWNGFGGKVEEQDQFEPGRAPLGTTLPLLNATDKQTILNATKRELREECLLVCDDDQYTHTGTLKFIFEPKPDQSLFVHIYLVHLREEQMANIGASDEMEPMWYPMSQIPYDNMWPDDKFWLPLALHGAFVSGVFIFDANNAITNYTLTAMKRGM